MKKCSTALVVLFLVFVSLSCSSSSGAEERPNIVLINLDDANATDLSRMPLTRSALQGTTFENSFVTDPLCCPSRASLLTGSYPHNHDIWSIYNSNGGGAKGFEDKGINSSNIGIWLHDSGYRTAMIGKWANENYSSEVPPGWDYWLSMQGDLESEHKLNENGRVFTYPDSTPQADILAEHTNQFTSQGGPFFAYVAPFSPHGPYDIASRDRGAFPNLRAPRSPSFNEKNISDKPPWIRRIHSLDKRDRRRLDSKYRQRVRSLESVDRMVDSIVTELESSGQLGNTYIIFTSDNGFLLGQFRLDSKTRPYEPSIRVPFVIRGPNVPEGTNSEMVLNNDLAPTLLDIAGISRETDGRSVLPLLSGESGRDAFLIEHRRLKRPDGSLSNSPSYSAIRTKDSIYIEYSTGQREFYNLNGDPYQLRNRFRVGGVDSTQIHELHTRLEALKACQGETCHEAESAPIPIPEDINSE